MAISDKTRKILWGRSGNRCAICKHVLVAEATPKDSSSVIGEECHILSPQTNGPRHDPMFPEKELDSCDNLILLCRIHHKMVDDQKETYAADVLRLMKSKHEKWVKEKLDSSEVIKQPKVRRIKKNMPDYLPRLTSGKQVLDIVDGSCSSSLDHDELETQEEVDLVGGFLQNARDWGDISYALETSDRVRIGFELTQSLKELEDAGFFVFGIREQQVLEGGVGGSESWPAAILHVLRKSNDLIVKVDATTICGGRDNGK